MKNITFSTFITAIALVFSIKSDSQTYRKGRLYTAMPLPEPTTSAMSAINSQALLYDMSVGKERVIAKDPIELNGVITMLKGLTLGSPGLSRKTDVATSSSCSITNPGDSEIYPHRAVVKLFIRFGNEYFVASGIMIGNRYVLTAGHCVYEPGYGWADEVVAVPGYYKGSEPYGSSKAISFLSWTGWTKHRNFDDDLGLIVLDKNMGDCTGWFGFGASTDDNFFLNNEWRVLSYPAANGWSGETLQFWRGYLSDVGKNIVRLYCQAIKGSSGGALYFRNQKSDRYVYGIYSHGNSFFTGLVRLTPNVVNDITELMKRWGSGSPCH